MAKHFWQISRVKKGGGEMTIDTQLVTLLSIDFSYTSNKGLWSHCLHQVTSCIGSPVLVPMEVLWPIDFYFFVISGS